MIRLNLYLYALFTIWFFVSCGGAGNNSSSGTSTQGKSGSMARFAIVGDYLYTVNESQMNVFDVANASQPKNASKVHLPWDVETLFAYKSYLYIGASSGMYIYDNSMPLQPTLLTKFTHAQSCDPVVVQDDIAYVTLNTGAGCWNNRSGINRLEIVNVENPEKPKLIKKVDMWKPTGLGIDKNILFICDGDSGLKVFDINATRDEKNQTKIGLSILPGEGDINCYDVIAYDKNLIVSNGNDIRQFEYSSFPMEEVSKIK